MKTLKSLENKLRKLKPYLKEKYKVKSNFWLLFKRETEQKEEIIKSERVEYGKKVVESLSLKLTQKYGKGFLNKICGIW